MEGIVSEQFSHRERQDDESGSYLDQARQYVADALSIYSRPAYEDEHQQALRLREVIELTAQSLRSSD
jgi:hypothetical protein